MRQARGLSPEAELIEARDGRTCPNPHATLDSTRKHHPRFLAAFGADTNHDNARVLDPGAGIGILACAICESAKVQKLTALSVVAYESDPVLHLEKLLKEYGYTAKRTYISAFLGLAEFRRHISHIAWETEVWIAEIPEHMIHFNGERYLGPYE